MVVNVIYRSANRAFSPIKRFSWVLVPIVALGGIVYPWLGFTVVGIMILLMGFGLLRGKYWCGNLCPHGSLFDVILLRRSPLRAIPGFFRSPILKWAFFVYFMIAFAGRLSGAFDYLGEPVFADRLGYVFVRQYLVWPTLIGIALALVINPRTWCSFCPMGTMQEVMYKAGALARLNGRSDVRMAWADSERCRHCSLCARVCPMQLEPHREIDDEAFHHACIRCSTCVEHCPQEALTQV